MANHGLTVTYLLLLNMRVEGFYSLSSGEIQVSTSQQHRYGLSHPRQGVALILWIAKGCNTTVTGSEILAHAVARACIASTVQGVAGIALDPYDAETAAMWQGPPHHFLQSNTKLRKEGLKRLWRPLPQLQSAVQPPAAT